MTDIEIARAMKVAIREAEVALARVDALATPEFRARQDANLVAKAEAAFARAEKAIGALHKALDKGGRANGDIAPQFGK
jgi:hypothetical protein